MPTSNQKLEDEATRVSRELDEWQSPKLGSLASLAVLSSSHRYESDPNAWINRDPSPRELDMDVVEPEFETPARPSRAQTPILSNASYDKMKNQQQQQQQQLMLTSAHDMDEELPVNVQSPWAVQPKSTVTKQTALVSSAHNPAKLTSVHLDCRRYYEVVETFLHAKRNLCERLDLQQQKGDLLLQDDEDAMQVDTDTRVVATQGQGPSTMNRKLVKDELFMELDFLRSLNNICWARAGDMEDPIRKEGNFWWLLYTLRYQGLPSLLWKDDNASNQQRQHGVAAFLQDLAVRRFNWTSEQVVQSLHSPEAPLVLQRRFQILKWLQDCFANILPQGVARARNGNMQVNSADFQQQGLAKTDKDVEVIQCALQLMLAGKLEEALQLARDSSSSWRAAAWGGGRPQGRTEQPDGSFKLHGNSRGFLWKRSMWKESERLSTDPVGSNAEGAIAALLSSNLKNALSNPSLRTWEHGLYATVSCMWDRTVDEAMHKHHHNRRQLQPPFPVEEQERIEVEVLRLTSDVAGISEADVVRILESSPFEEMKCQEIATRATESFLEGESAILGFLQESVECMDPRDPNVAESLRFLTHLVLYLDSLASASTPITLPGVEQWKNELLRRYIGFLESQDGLWHMVVLYSSLLPTADLMESLPRFLSTLENANEREVLVKQLRDLLPQAGMDLIVLRQVVQLVLDESDPSEDINDPTLMDARKMRAVLWLCIDGSPRYGGEAVIAATQLLRQFLLAGKFRSAINFVDAMFPFDIVEAVARQLDGNEVEDKEASVAVAQFLMRNRIKNAHSELVAFHSYLDALTSYEQWLKVVEDNPAEKCEEEGSDLDRSKWNATEASIADQMERRNIVEQKRATISTVVAAAHDAQNALYSLLTHPGGWLLTEDEVNAGTEEEKLRDLELSTLRAKLLPKVVQLYQDVCLQASDWLTRSTDNAALRLKVTVAEAISLLDESSQDTKSPILPQYWAGQCLEIAKLVASDKYKISSVFGKEELSEVLEKMGQAAIVQLL